MGAPDGSALDVLRTTSAHVVVPADVLDAGMIGLDEPTRHHLGRVLRLRTGESVSATDGAGRWRLGTVVGDGASISIQAAGPVVEEQRREAPITIATAIPKGDRLDWLVQKVAELGADRLMLLHAERSVVRWKADRAARHLDRLRRIADEACRQSRRVWRLEIDGPIEAASVLGEFAVAEPGGRPLAPTDRAVAVGPEGGWSPAELSGAHDRVALGDTILRTETAAVAATALCVALGLRT
jgi:16S rRNA (uracil1498-N3)-methyltransferase